MLSHRERLPMFNRREAAMVTSTFRRCQGSQGVAGWRRASELCAPTWEKPDDVKSPLHSPDRQLLHAKPITSGGCALPFVRRNEQFRRPLGGGGYLERIGRPQRPPLEKFDGARHNLLRDVDKARVFHVFEERLLDPSILLGRELPLTAASRKRRNNFQRANYRDA